MAQFARGLWLRQWVVSTGDSLYYVEGYAWLGAATGVLLLLRVFVIVFGSLQSARSLHQRLLRRVLYAPMSFFDATPVGRYGVYVPCAYRRWGWGDSEAKKSLCT